MGVSRLSLVVRVSDPLLPTGETVGAVRLRLEPGGQSPLYNLSGAPCFVDLPAGDYTLSIDSAHYFRVQQPLTLPMSDQRQPVWTAVLRPLPSYPFPGGTTLIRGMVRDNAGTPVAGATLTVPVSGLQAQTTEQGEFALAWPVVSAAQVVLERQRDGAVRRCVAGEHGGKQLQLAVTHPEAQAYRMTIPEVAEGTTTNIGVITVTRSRATGVEATQEGKVGDPYPHLKTARNLR